MILEAAELASLRADVRQVMEETSPDRCAISRGTVETRNPDSPDQFTVAPDAKETDIPCSYRVSNSSERFLAGKPSDINFFTVTVPAGIDAAEDDAVTIAAKGADAAVSLRVDTVMRKSNAVQWKLLCADA